jgi:signal transduction histidine kinase
MLRDPSPEELAGYLLTLQSSVELDFLAVRDLSGRLLAGSDLDLDPLPQLGHQSGFFRLQDDSGGLALLATEPVIDGATGQTIAFVTAGLRLDDDFAGRLRDVTGFEHTFVIGQTRGASSLPGQPDATSERQMTFEGVPYYVARQAVAGPSGDPIASLEIALPVGGLVEAERRALTVLAVSTLLVAALGSAVGWGLARRLTAPLEALTAAAQNITRGDLTTPIPIPTEPVEAVTLARALEESRVHILATLEQLSHAKAWSENLIRSVVEGVVTFDSGGLITFFSEGAERILSLPAAQTVGQPVSHVFRVADENGAGFLDTIPPAGKKSQVALLDGHGHPITLAITGARLIPPEGDLPQVVLVLRDVTEEEATRNLRSYFLANITHEFRTPLSALSASIELLMDEAEAVDDPGLAELLGSLHLSVVGLQTLIDNLLESTSIEAGKFKIRLRSIDLNAVVGQAIRAMTPLLSRRSQSLSLAEPTALPEIQADANRLTQVLTNLLSNASKYSPPGSAIDLSVERTRHDALKVVVADRGPGIPEAERSHLFRRFVRLDSGEKEQYGIGLGLAVAKAIVEGHGGQIGVDARPGGGSLFWFTLPVKRVG